MGTADFAVPSLETLIQNGYKPVAVITAPDKPAGRGQKLRFSPVKQSALQYGIPILQPENLKDEKFLEQLQSYHPGLQIVVAFRMLPKSVWQLPVNGTFNLHASLLPQYRGAAPINHAIMNGETETGVTTFFIDDKIDTGKIIDSKKISIGINETAGELHDRLMIAGADLVLKTVRTIEDGNIQLKDQSALLDPSEPMKPAPKIFKEDCKIEWQQPGRKIYDFIRGLSPYPAAYFNLMLKGDKKAQVKVFRAEKEVIQDDQRLQPGAFESDGKHFFNVGCADGKIHIRELQMEGKRRMAVEEFLKGFDMSRIHTIN